MARIVRKVVGGTTGAPFNSVRDEVAAVGGIEEEFLFEGRARQFRLAGGTAEYGTDGRWLAEPVTRRSFRSRMLVVRPRDPADFNGTVIVSWNNVSRGQDLFAVDPQTITDGFAVVGVTTQLVGVEGRRVEELPREFAYVDQGLPGLKGYDPERYGSLQHPGDGFSYDIFTQAAGLLGPHRPRALDPLGGLAVRHLVATGGSQSANRLATYINAVQPVSHAYDGFLLTVYAGCPCALDPATAPESLPQVPSNVVQLLPWRTYRLRDDLEVPIVIVNSEFEAEQCHPNTQPDTEYLRWWEVAGTAHGGLMPATMLDGLAAVMPDACVVSFAPVVRAAREALRRWLDDGAPPPHQPRLRKQGNPPALPRDEHGNATGGIRWPDVEAPLGTHVGESPAEGFVQLMGRSTPFPPEKLRALYGDRSTWFARYQDAVDRLVESRVVLPDDAAAMIARASKRELPI